MADLQAAVHKARPKLYPARQRFTLPKKNGEKKPVALAAGKRLADYDLADGTELTFKDLGPQARRSAAACKESLGFGPEVSRARNPRHANLRYWHGVKKLLAMEEGV